MVFILCRTVVSLAVVQSSLKLVHAETLAESVDDAISGEEWAATADGL